MAVQEVKPFTTPQFRGAFVWVLRGKTSKPRAGEAEKKPRFTILMLFPKGTDLKEMRAGVLESAVNLWGPKADAVMKMPNYKGAFKPALEVVNPDGEPYFPWAEGYTAVETWSYVKPGLVGPHNDPATGKLEHLTTDADFYSGAWARARVRPYSYDGRKDQKGFGTNFELVNVQKLRDDEKLGASVRTNAEDDFQPVAPVEEDEFA